MQGSGAREGDVEYLVAFGTIVILPCGSRASNRIERALELLTMILLLRTRRDLRKGEIGKILHDSEATSMVN